MWTGRTGRAGIRFRSLTQRSWSHLERWLRESQDPLGEMLQNLKLQKEQSTAAAPETTSDSKQELDIETAFALITERACTVTRANGAALIMLGPEGFVCRASVGSAPDLGTVVQAGPSLTGDCLRLGVTVKCADTMMDARVNADAREQLSVRSVLAVPVLLDAQIIGALEVFSSAVEAFTERDVRRLEQLADIAAHSEDFTAESVS